MKYDLIKENLTYFDSNKIERYINYLKLTESDKKRDGTLKNPWFKYFTESQAIGIYKKVAIDGLSIDGESITLQFKGKVIVSYNYQAYKNKLLMIYPETKFDLQIVNEGDDISFHKENGKVIYSHKINDPFNIKPKIIGTYCIIKNKRGEFLETLNITEIDKMKAVAKTKVIWDEWFSEMVLKSVIKRACKRHFKDITANIENLDNESVDLELLTFDETVQKKIEKIKTFDGLKKLYHSEINTISDKVKFVELLTDRKTELKKLLPEITTSEHSKAIKMLKSGSNQDALLLIWNINSDVMETLISKSL